MTTCPAFTKMSVAKSPKANTPTRRVERNQSGDMHCQLVLAPEKKQLGGGFMMTPSKRFQKSSCPFTFILPGYEACLLNDHFLQILTDYTVGVFITLCEHFSSNIVLEGGVESLSPMPWAPALVLSSHELCSFFDPQDT